MGRSTADHGQGDGQIRDLFGGYAAGIGLKDRKVGTFSAGEGAGNVFFESQPGRSAGKHLLIYYAEIWTVFKIQKSFHYSDHIPDRVVTSTKVIAVTEVI